MTDLTRQAIARAPLPTKGTDVGAWLRAVAREMRAEVDARPGAYGAQGRREVLGRCEVLEAVGDAFDLSAVRE